MTLRIATDEQLVESQARENRKIRRIRAASRVVADYKGQNSSHKGSDFWPLW